MSLWQQLDPLARAEIETLAGHWRDVYPAGWSYHEQILRLLTDEREASRITGDDASWLYVRACQYANGEANTLVLDDPPASA